MGNEVSLGGAYATFDMDLVPWQRDVKVLLASIADINKQLDGIKFDPAGIAAGVASAQKSFDSLKFDTTPILAGIDKVKESLGSLPSIVSDVQRSINSLKFSPGKVESGSAKASAAIEGIGKAAKIAQGNIDTVNFGVANAIVAEAAAARDAVSSLGSAATRTGRKLDTLKLDPAGVIAGADAATVAVDRLAASTGRAKGMLAGLRVPVSTGGGAVGGRSGASGIGGAVSSAAVNAAAGVTILAAITGDQAAHFDTLSQQVAGNTNMSAANLAEMKQAALEAGKLGADREQALNAYFFASAHDYFGREATNIIVGASKMNVGTGVDVGKAADTISSLLHQRKEPATEANVMKIANLVHQSTASGKMDVSQFVQYGAPAVGKAYALGNPMEDSSAFLTALTQQNVRIPQAATNLAGITWQITHPTDKAQKAIDNAGLQHYFGAGALANNGGLYNILQHVWGASGNNSKKFGELFGGVEEMRKHGSLIDAKGIGGDQNKLMNIFGNKQGGFGALIATGVGADDYRKQLYDPKFGNYAATSGKINPIQERFDQASKTPGVQWQQAKGAAFEKFEPIGEKFIHVFTQSLPILSKFADGLSKVLDAFSKLPQPLQNVVFTIGGLAIAAKALETFTGISAISEGLGKGGKLAAHFFGRGGAEAAEGAAAGGALDVAGLAAAAAPIAAVTAGVIALGAAWKTNFGGIRDITGSVVRQVTAWFKANLPEIMETVRTITGTMSKLWHDHGARVLAIVRPLWQAIGDIVMAGVHLVEGVLKLGMDIINGHWGRVWGDIVNTVSKVGSRIGAAVGHIAQVIGNTLLLIGSAIFDAIKRFDIAMFHLGVNIVEGIINGINSVIHKVGDVISGLAKSAITQFKSVLGIASPSKVFRQFGVNIGEGLIEGLKDVSPRIESQLDKVLALALSQKSKTQARGTLDSGLEAIRSSLPKDDKVDRAYLAHATPALHAGLTVAFDQTKAREYEAHLGRVIALRERLNQMLREMHSGVATSDGRSSDASAQLAARVQVAGDNFRVRLDAADKWRQDAGVSTHDSHYKELLRGAVDEYGAAKKAAQDEYTKTLNESAAALDRFNKGLDISLSRSSGKIGDLEAQRQYAKLEADSALKENLLFLATNSKGGVIDPADSDRVNKVHGAAYAAADAEYTRAIRDAAMALDSLTGQMNRAAAVAAGRMSDLEARRQGEYASADSDFAVTNAEIADKSSGQPTDKVAAAFTAAKALRDAQKAAADVEFNDATLRQNLADLKDEYDRGTITVDGYQQQLTDLAANTLPLSTAAVKELKAALSSVDVNGFSAQLAVLKNAHLAHTDTDESYRTGLQRLADTAPGGSAPSAEAKRLLAGLDGVAAKAPTLRRVLLAAISDPIQAAVEHFHSLNDLLRSVMDSLKATFLKLGSVWLTRQVFGADAADGSGLPGKGGGNKGIGGILGSLFGKRKPSVPAIPALNFGVADNIAAGLVPPAQQGKPVVDAVSNGIEQIGTAKVTDKFGIVSDLVKQQFTGVAKGVGKDFKDVLGQVATMFQGGGGAGGGGQLSGILASGLSLVPGWGAAASVGLGALGSIFHFADGGVMLPNRPAFVAEAGTGGELVIPHGQSTAIPMNKLGGNSVTINHYGDNHGIEDVEAMTRQLAWHAQQMMPTSKGGN